MSRTRPDGTWTVGAESEGSISFDEMEQKIESPLKK
jgi:hypothetical protein